MAPSITTSLSLISLFLSSVSAAVAPSATVSAGTYSLALFPAVTAAPACISGCLAPAIIGAGAICGSDTPTNDCACLNAPGEAQLAIMSCASASCAASQSAYASLATSLYTSYCNGQYLPTAIESASAAEAPIMSSLSAAAASSSKAAAASASSASTKKGAAAPTGVAAEGYVFAVCSLLLSMMILQIC
jgi:hypothetical protein